MQTTEHLGVYLLRRMGILLLTAFLASIIVFIIMRMLPGDITALIIGDVPSSPAVKEALREELGLNDSPILQYARWLWSMVSGGFGGQSLLYGQEIRTLLARQLPVTLFLTLYAVGLSLVVSVPLGVGAALKWNRWQDYLVRFLVLPGQALPNFWVALLLLLGLMHLFQWSPPVVYTHPWENPWNHFQMLIVPVLLLAWEYSSHVVRVTRASILDTMHEDYIVTARAKGLSERQVIFGHALRSALPPVVTVLGLQFGVLLGGTLILESIFGLPGLGRGFIQAAVARDYPVVQSFVTLLVCAVLSVNLIVDLVYRVVDPRISFATQARG